MMDFIIIQKWRRNMKWEIDKPSWLKMNDRIVQDVFSEIVCLKLVGLMFEEGIVFSVCWMCEKGDWCICSWMRVNDISPAEHCCCTWYGGCVVGSCFFSQTIVNIKRWIQSWNNMSCESIIVIECVSMNTTLVFNQCVCLKWMEKGTSFTLIHLLSWCVNYENGITTKIKNKMKSKQMEVRNNWRRERERDGFEEKSSFQKWGKSGELK